MQGDVKQNACKVKGGYLLSEVESLVKNNTWKIIKKSKVQRSVGCRVVLTNKYAADGSIERRKTRIVAKGSNQRFGTDYHCTFARLESIRLLLALSVEFDLTIWQFDIITAYLNGNLEEEVNHGCSGNVVRQSNG